MEFLETQEVDDGGDSDATEPDPSQQNPDEPKPVAVLVLLKVGEDTNQKGAYPLYDGENLIGRKDKCNVRLNYDWISGKHAMLDVMADEGEDASYTIKDRGSRNGTFRRKSAGEAEEKLTENKPYKLTHGMLLKFGNIE